MSVAPEQHSDGATRGLQGKGGGGEFPGKVSATSSGQSRVVCLCFALRTDFAQFVTAKAMKEGVRAGRQVLTVGVANKKAKDSDPSNYYSAHTLTAKISMEFAISSNFTELCRLRV